MNTSLYSIQMCIPHKRGKAAPAPDMVKGCYTKIGLTQSLTTLFGQQSTGEREKEPFESPEGKLDDYI